MAFRADLRDASLLLGLSIGLGLMHAVLRPELPWIAEKKEEVCAVEATPAALVERVTVEQARQWLGRDNVTFIDARSSDDYLRGHIPGAISLPAGEAAGILELASVPIDPHALVVTYCDGAACERSEYLGLLLRNHAVCEQVRVLTGGWTGWLAAGGPVTNRVEQGSAP